ncbi:hypothetical protein SLEP1_g25595 [Rubroshorea leprosula]|uniref:Uncharacterized protein n=1 Tax=Rubroshorea leprosula TaxID=152421 RepID=A0AAV5JVN1_9ROSI|nr:hypothetical protein SLEP1_g25595 [Rubroshorea leprosula]
MRGCRDWTCVMLESNNNLCLKWVFVSSYIDCKDSTFGSGNSGGDGGGGGGGRLAKGGAHKWELSPRGMLVQKRNPDSTMKALVHLLFFLSSASFSLVGV